MYIYLSDIYINLSLINMNPSGIKTYGVGRYLLIIYVPVETII